MVDSPGASKNPLGRPLCEAAVSREDAADAAASSKKPDGSPAPFVLAVDCASVLAAADTPGPTPGSSTGAAARQSVLLSCCHDVRPHCHACLYLCKRTCPCKCCCDTY